MLPKLKLGVGSLKRGPIAESSFVVFGILVKENKSFVLLKMFQGCDQQFFICKARLLLTFWIPITAGSVYLVPPSLPLLNVCLTCHETVRRPFSSDTVWTVRILPDFSFNNLLCKLYIENVYFFTTVPGGFCLLLTGSVYLICFVKLTRQSNVYNKIREL